MKAWLISAALMMLLVVIGVVVSEEIWLHTPLTAEEWARAQEEWNPGPKHKTRGLEAETLPGFQFIQAQAVTLNLDGQTIGAIIAVGALLTLGNSFLNKYLLMPKLNEQDAKMERMMVAFAKELDGRYYRVADEAMDRPLTRREFALHREEDLALHRELNTWQERFHIRLHKAENDIHDLEINKQDRDLRLPRRNDEGR